jgi:HrpA-like RNA helicase
MVKTHITFDDEPAAQANPFSLKSNGARVPSAASEPVSNGQSAKHLSKTSEKVKEPEQKKRIVNFQEDKEGFSSARITNGTHHVRQSHTTRQKLAEDRGRLPIAQHADQLREKVRENSCLVLLGETGSGKSTQLPQFLLDDVPEGCIAVTQPRRVAAINLAKRVAEERDCRLGREVGYAIRFDDQSSKHTRIKYLTDGMLLIELMNDPLLSRYSVIILDEAHERTLLTDLLLGFMKLLLKRRMGFKVVVMSATLDAERFSAFFDDAEIVTIEGRTFPVELYYTKTSQQDYLDAILRTVFQIHMGQPSGDLLVFLTGSDEIENLATLIRDYAEQLSRDVPRMLVLPLYASLPQDQQARVFAGKPKNTRKIILSTNLAETSVTVPGVRYVIDSGLQKVKSFNSKLGFESLEVSPVSRSSAEQRTGRAGREAPGKCWRLYTETTFKTLDQTASPEIARVSLASAVLALKTRGVDDVLGFPYIDPPARDALVRALEELYALGALDDGGRITPVGKHMSTLPLSPALARVLIAAGEQAAVHEVIDIVACLSVDGLFVDRASEREDIAAARARLASTEGDHLTLLNVVRQYLDVLNSQAEQDGPESVSTWCKQMYLDQRALRTILDIRKQLLQHAARAGLVGADPYPSSTRNELDLPERILRSILIGFVTHTAFLSPDGSYRTTNGNTAVAIHPSSTLYGKKHEAIVYHESVFTTRLWVRGVSRIETTWLRETAPHYAGRRST